MNFDRNRFHIGTYILQPYARDEERIREMAECGIDLVFAANSDKAMLDLFEKYGIGAVVNDVVPGWWGGDGENAGKLAEKNPIENYISAAEKFVDHPAIVGIDIGDEPSAKDFPYYGVVADAVGKAFPNKLVYLNLYPNYASIAKNNSEETVNQLGTATYDEHIAEYCKYVGLDYISYDNYLYTAGTAHAYENLRVVADASLKTGRPMWIILQVNSHNKSIYISENQLRFQAYSALCFGPEIITWACYTAGWFYNQVLDENGRKTEQYEKLKKVNTELWAISEAYMKYRRVDTHFLSFDKNDPELTDVKIQPIERLDTGRVTELTVTKGKKLIVGQFAEKAQTGKCALAFCAADDSQDTNNGIVEVQFKAYAQSVVMIKDAKTEELTRNADGFFRFSLESSHGAFIEIL